MAKITEKRYNAVCNRLRKYMEKELPFLDGTEVGWYEDMDNLEENDTYSWRAYNPLDDKTYKITCEWTKKKVYHHSFKGDIYKKKW